jgi:hypothetical protein
MPACEIHIVNNCPICAKAKPAVIPAPTQQLSVPKTGSVVPEVSTAPSAAISDPHAAKVLAAASKYAEYCDTFKTISDEIKVYETKMLDAKKRAANVATLRENAQAELVKLMGEKA